MAEQFSCSECGRKFTRQFNRDRHFNVMHNKNSTNTERCFLCGSIFVNQEKLQEHITNVHKPSKRFFLQKKAFDRNFSTYRFIYNGNLLDFNRSQSILINPIMKTVLSEAAKLTICKVSLVFIAEMMMLDNQGGIISKVTIPFRASNFLANASTPQSLKRQIIRSFNQQRENLDKFMNTGSNWVFNRAYAFDIEFSALRPLVVGKGQKAKISHFKNKKFLYNPENEDEKCFLYCIAFFLLERKQIGNIDKRKTNLEIKMQIKKFNIKGIKFPISIEQIKKFLRQNPSLDIKINILFANSAPTIFPYEFGLGDGKNTVNLLMVQRKDEEDDFGVNHFLLIKDINKFLRSHYLGSKNTKSYQKCNYCLNCLHSFSSPKILHQHQKICCMNKPRLEHLPEKEGGNIIRFKNFHHQYLRNYIGFLDFECILPKEKKTRCEVCSSLRCKCEKSFTEVLSQQEPIGYSFVIMENDNILHEKTYMGPDAGLHFVKHILEEEKKWIKPMLENICEMDISSEEQEHFDNQTHCYMCDTELSTKVRDHSHTNGNYLGASCTNCNLLRRRPQKLKIFIHNGSRFDYHFIVKALSNCHLSNLNVLPYNGENFRTISFNSFEFNDSLAFLQASLAQLTEDLSNSKHDYQILKQTFLVKDKKKQFSPKKLELLLKKSFFPYEYCTSYEKMETTTKCPNIKAFYSSLSEKSITREEHNFVKKTWSLFKCRNLLDYARIYCKLDTILLAEVFQKFRKEMFNFSGLDPAFYISLPSYSFDSMLKLTKCVITTPNDDINKIHFIENGIRGGMSFIGSRKLEPVNNESEIVYIDANVRISFN
jgi:hypothetical protein